MLDFAVNVRHPQPPAWLVERLAARLTDLGRYPAAADQQAAVQAVAHRHGVPADHVLLLNGGTEGFALLPALRPRLAALIAPSFTEPEAILTAAGVALRQLGRHRPRGLAVRQVDLDRVQLRVVDSGGPA
jgi:histidinol-phosphate aminotransferase